MLLADGGTRTAAITGAYVALADACAWLVRPEAIVGSVSAVSVGVVAGETMLDLCYEEDSNADTDMNVVITGEGTFVEVQGTAEKSAFDRAALDSMLDLAVAGCSELATVQRAVLAEPLGRPGPGAAHGGGPRGTGATALQDGQDRLMALRIVLATRNRGKIDELRRILGAAYELMGLPDEAPEVAETGATFEDNALLKARSAAEHTGLIAVADDSGLTVDALNGMPGILSARWSGRHGNDEANLALVLGQVSEIPDERRGAAFVCAAALVTPDGRRKGRARPTSAVT